MYFHPEKEIKEGHIKCISILWSRLMKDIQNVHSSCNENSHLRNEFNFWSVHGIMNTSGLLQSK